MNDNYESGQVASLRAEIEHLRGKLSLLESSARLYYLTLLERTKTAMEGWVDPVDTLSDLADIYADSFGETLTGSHDPTKLKEIILNGSKSPSL